MLAVVLPKGSLEKQDARPVQLRRPAPSCAAPTATTTPASTTRAIDKVRFLRPQEIPTYVEQGIFDLGISGRDWITETGADVVSLGEIGGGRAGEAVVSVVLAVPKESPWQSRGGPARRRPHLHGDAGDDPPLPRGARREGQGLHLARRHRGQDPGHRRRDRRPHRDRLLAAQGRPEDHRYPAHQPDRAIANREAYADPAKRAAMDDVVLLLQGALRARGHVLLKLNVDADRLDAVLAVLPAMSSPTVMSLASGDARALETVVPKLGVNELIPSLRSAGARDILELPISKIVESGGRHRSPYGARGRPARRRAARAPARRSSPVRPAPCSSGSTASSATSWAGRCRPRSSASASGWSSCSASSSRDRRPGGPGRACGRSPSGSGSAGSAARRSSPSVRPRRRSWAWRCSASASSPGQTGGGVLVDRVGLGPGGRRALTGPRLAGALLCLVAVAVSVVGKGAREAAPLLLVLVVLAGLATTLQQAFNGHVRAATGDSSVATLLNFLVGGAALVLGLAGSVLLSGAPDGAWPGADHWYLYVGRRDRRALRDDRRVDGARARGPAAHPHDHRRPAGRRRPARPARARGGRDAVAVHRPRRGAHPRRGGGQRPGDPVRRAWPAAVQLVLGLVLFGAGLWLGLQAHLGVGPWDVLHGGLAEHLGTPFGRTSIAVGGVVLVVAVIAGVRPGSARCSTSCSSAR